MPTPEFECDALVVGAGPAGLMAADEISGQGHSVILAEAKTSFARKFLMAGKSGLNVTKDEPIEDLLKSYGPSHPALESALRSFGPEEVKQWLTELGQSFFVGSTKRVFPTSMKASPLLRAWLARLSQNNVQFLREWRLVGLDRARGNKCHFRTPDGASTITAKVVILALGGSSWARLGSDGAWVPMLETRAEIAPFQPSNVGLDIFWTDFMAPHFGAPIKGTMLRAGSYSSRGEFVISKTGLEGGGIYAVTRGIREGERLTIDLLPDWNEERIKQTLIKRKNKENLSRFLSRGFKLSAEKRALFMEFARDRSHDLVANLKNLDLGLPNLRPMDEAISTAGGVSFNALTDRLEFKSLPSFFAAGEMLDWDAPTGGYLITACLATGRMAAKGALSVLQA